MNSCTTILVALDFGRQSSAALNEALRLADSLKAKIHLLHVSSVCDSTPQSPRPSNFRKHLQDAQRAQLNIAVSRCRASGKLGAVLWETGDPAAQILLTAEAVGAAMLMLGASGRNSLPSRRLGSVAEAVVRGARCTVIVVRDPNVGHEDNVQ